MSTTVEEAELLKAKPWYHEKLDHELDPTLIKYLEERGIAKSEQVAYVVAIRNKAWQLYPYPCIGMFYFLRFATKDNPRWDTILARMRNGNRMLDLGCGFAQDLRNLVAHGVDANHLVALDNHNGFFNLGYELFRDRDTFTKPLVIADVTDLSSMPPEILGTFDIIWAGAIFHLFDWDRQVVSSIVALKLLKPKPGSVIAGYQVGAETGHAITNSEFVKQTFFRHDAETFKKLWKEVSDKTNTHWDVQSTFDVEHIDDLRRVDERSRRHCFWVERLA